MGEALGRNRNFRIPKTVSYRRHCAKKLYHYVGIAILVVVPARELKSEELAELPVRFQYIGTPDQITVWNSNTLTIAEENQQRIIGLAGISVPDLNVLPWGPVARAALDELVRDQPVTCTATGVIIHDRIIAICGTPKVPDMGLALIHEGLAMSERQYANADLAPIYDAAERQARLKGKGFWNRSELPQSGACLVIERWQTLIAGILALIAAIVGAGVLAWNTIKIEKATRDAAQQQANAMLKSAEAGLSAVKMEIEQQSKNSVDAFNREQHQIASALAGEIEAFTMQISIHINKNQNNCTSLREVIYGNNAFLPFTKVNFIIYENCAEKIGFLPNDLPAMIVKFYNDLQWIVYEHNEMKLMSSKGCKPEKIDFRLQSSNKNISDILDIGTRIIQRLQDLGHS